MAVNLGRDDEREYKWFACAMGDWGWIPRSNEFGDEK